MDTLKRLTLAFRRDEHSLNLVIKKNVSKDTALSIL